MTLIDQPMNDPGGSAASITSPRESFDLSPSEKKFVGYHLVAAITALMIGSLMGPLQSFQFSGVDVYPYLDPIIKSYYQGLTLHGVLNALVWTTLFIVGSTNLTTIAAWRKDNRCVRLTSPLAEGEPVNLQLFFAIADPLEIMVSVEQR